jgi:hypothetical protein
MTRRRRKPPWPKSKKVSHSWTSQQAVSGRCIARQKIASRKERRGAQSCAPRLLHFVQAGMSCWAALAGFHLVWRAMVSLMRCAKASSSTWSSSRVTRFHGCGALIMLGD